MENFKHGGDIRAFAKEINCRVDEVIDLSSNINFIKPKIDIDFNSLNITSYPEYSSLKETIAKRYGVDKSQLELFNGATTAIYSLFRTLKMDRCILYSPIYLEYKRSALLNGYSISYIDRFQNINGKIDEESLVIFVNPSTPDGLFYNIDNFMQKWIDKRATILIDESFLDFTPFNSSIPYLNSYNRLYILKSMTKFYGSAGVRVGVIISNSKSIDNIRVYEPLWKISQFDSRYMESALRDRDFIKNSNYFNKKSRDFLIDILKNYRYTHKIYPSTANFILIKLKEIDAKEFQKILIPYKIMVRDCSNFDFLDKSFIRIAIKDIKRLKVLERALLETS